jgi:putative YhdH/YhfP family quinone oxidoreductase
VRVVVLSGQDDDRKCGLGGIEAWQGNGGVEQAMTDSFRAYRLKDSGTPRGSFVTRSLDQLDAGDVVVRVAFSDVNYKDALAATGKGRILRRPECIGGLDFSGLVSVSTDARFPVGTSVVAAGFDLGVSHDGGYSEYVRVPADWLTPLPASLSLWEAMAFGTAGFTAALAILRMEHNGLTPAGGPVVVSGATGGVGSIAIAALARLGYAVTALTGKGEERAYLAALGAKEVLLRDELDLTSIKPLGKSTWAGAIDNLGGDVLAWMASTMKVNGVIGAIGLALSPTLQTTVLPFILRGVSLLGFNSNDSPTAAQRAEAWRRLATDLKPSALPAIARTVEFDDLPAAFDDFINSRIRGRVVVRIEGKS